METIEGSGFYVYSKKGGEHYKKIKPDNTIDNDRGVTAAGYHNAIAYLIYNDFMLISDINKMYAKPYKELQVPKIVEDADDILIKEAIEPNVLNFTWIKGSGLFENQYDIQLKNWRSQPTHIGNFKSKYNGVEIDSDAVLEYNGKSYFFKNNIITSYDPNGPLSVYYIRNKTIPENHFLRVPNDVTAAMYVTANRAYFFKKRRFYLVNLSSMAVEFMFVTPKFI
ncbi:DgyrCDS4531 [Dimorphilus gyrociliatus]|uniref:DgyrCDS4531 n=1 Tax=Dimorphilus gyrociliatus TaxID=2664684 RepID=A0A7I8VJX6_9ANNE|nr:DgyrCDS4531 [Dimorphilus gyrociliatus]